MHAENKKMCVGLSRRPGPSSHLLELLEKLAVARSLESEARVRGERPPQVLVHLRRSSKGRTRVSL